MLSHTKPNIAQEALALIKAMLFSGNVIVQSGIEENARETREETLFLNLKHILETASQNYKNMYKNHLYTYCQFYFVKLLSHRREMLEDLSQGITTEIQRPHCIQVSWIIIIRVK